jgi:2-dehydro-3-deoxyphosphogalactonate aldolase
MMEHPQIIAILRGIQPFEAVDIGNALIEAGIRLIEIPLNSPKPFESIGKMVSAIGDKAVFGAGTVLNPIQCNQLADVGGKLVVSPNSDAAIIKRALSLNQVPIPGIFTPTEAFVCIDAGAKHLKLFPGSVLGVQMPKALRAVIPADIKIYAVGGVVPSNIQEWLSHGATGVGIGSGIYRPGDSAQSVYKKARKYMEHFLQ